MTGEARRKVATLRRAVTGLGAVGAQAAGLRSDLDLLRAQLGSLESREVARLAPDRIREAEFRVFSQFGEDGVIQFLAQRVPIENDIFVEFGVEDYRESNTRFLLVHDNWRGLVLDAGHAMHEFLRSTGLAWRHDIEARTTFIDRDNINGVIRDADVEGDIGLLSIDLDGNDYWIFEAIEVVLPRILVVEYNSTFGAERAVTVPYDPGFVRGEKHWSWLYWGASLAAMTRLANAKGLALVGGNSAGNNAFFVRRDLLGQIPEVSVAQAYRPGRFRESRNREGELSYVGSLGGRLRLIEDMPLVDVETGYEATVAGLVGRG
jgi:hypothetical protein